jgi:hypothetical protein
LQESMHGTSRFRNTIFPVNRKHKAYSNSNFARTGFTLIMQPLSSHVKIKSQRPRRH